MQNLQNCSFIFPSPLNCPVLSDKKNTSKKRFHLDTAFKTTPAHTKSPRGMKETLHIFIVCVFHSDPDGRDWLADPKGGNEIKKGRQLEVPTLVSCVAVENVKVAWWHFFIFRLALRPHDNIIKLMHDLKKLKRLYCSKNYQLRCLTINGIL